MADESTSEKMTESIKTLEERLSELSDLQIINKLDIINLKNEMEKFGLSGQAVSPQPGSAGPPVCKKCGTVIPEGTKFCRKCGKKVKR